MFTIHNLYSDHLLLASSKKPNKNWSGYDSESLYKEHLKTQPEDWYYRTHTVTYELNSNKYRCAEWCDINWSDSWIVFGCSTVEGLGLDEPHVLSTRLSELLGDPVINLGQAGTGADVTLFNSIRLIDKNIRPKGVIIVNGDFTLARLSLFTTNKWMPLGNWVIDKNKTQGMYSDLYSSWIRFPDHAETHSYMSLRGAISMWKAENIPTFYFNVERDLPKKSDLARDLSHPGQETIKLWAQTIVNTISTQ